MRQDFIRSGAINLKNGDDQTRSVGRLREAKPVDSRRKAARIDPLGGSSRVEGRGTQRRGSGLGIACERTQFRSPSNRRISFPEIMMRNSTRFHNDESGANEPNPAGWLKSTGGEHEKAFRGHGWRPLSARTDPITKLFNPPGRRRVRGGGSRCSGARFPRPRGRSRRPRRKPSGRNRIGRAT